MKMKGDNPIQQQSDDSLGRAGAAKSFARRVLDLDASEGVVVAVLGPWGSGKTSFVNLAKPDLQAQSSAIIEFNPWMFSGAEQLVQSFFVEIAAQLKLKPGLDQIGDDLQEYGELLSGLGWLPVVGPWIERGRGLSKLASKMLQRRREGVGGRRQKLIDALAGLAKPIVLVIDDIDRLTTSEIRDIFKLIRLTASFPNVIYVASFDRQRVEDALAEQGIPGRDYLEKILQVGVDLPVIPESVMDKQVFQAIDLALEGVEPAVPFNESAWPDVYAETIRPLLRNMRDVRRYAASVRGTLVDLQGQVELVDVLALEAIRVFLPDVFHRLPSTVDGLTKTAGYSLGSDRDEARLKAQVEDLLAAGGDQLDAVTSVVSRLFPAAARHLGGSTYEHDWESRWLRERRVAQADVLRLYLERVAGDGLKSFVAAESAWSLMTDRQAFDAYLRSLDPDLLQDVISNLNAYADDFTEAHAVPSIVVLLNLLPELPDQKRSMFDLGARMVVGGIVYRLLSALPGEVAVESVVKKVLPELSTLSAKLEIVSLVGHQEGRGQRLVSEAVAAQLEQDWRQEVREARPGELTKEPELLRCLFLTQRDAEAGEDALGIATNPDFTAAILASARSERISQSMGSRAVRRSPQLAWDVLVELYGDQTAIEARLKDLRSSNEELDEDLLTLVQEYLDGWRPDHLDD